MRGESCGPFCVPRSSPTCDDVDELADRVEVSRQVGARAGRRAAAAAPRPCPAADQVLHEALPAARPGRPRRSSARSVRRWPCRWWRAAAGPRRPARRARHRRSTAAATPRSRRPSWRSPAARRPGRSKAHRAACDRGRGRQRRGSRDRHPPCAAAPGRPGPGPASRRAGARASNAAGGIEADHGPRQRQGVEVESVDDGHLRLRQLLHDVVQQGLAALDAEVRLQPVIGDGLDARRAHRAPRSMGTRSASWWRSAVRTACREVVTAMPCLPGSARRPGDRPRSGRA